jgi:4-hydroxy-tetrahydrodipicolinate reductase
MAHEGTGRRLLPHGALRAARFLADKPNGLFDMYDVLGLNG